VEVVDTVGLEWWVAESEGAVGVAPVAVSPPWETNIANKASTIEQSWEDFGRKCLCFESGTREMAPSVAFIPS
jgi:hypothetical protein